jgi:hypothetical protein
MSGEVDYTIDELVTVCVARQVQNGDLLAQGLSTPLVAAGYLLAWRTHAPDVLFASAIGQSVCSTGAPLGLASVEGLWLDRALTSAGFVQGVCDWMPRMRPKEWFRPAQVDRHGNFNNIAFGKSRDRPRLRLPGTGGIPDVTCFLDGIYLYVPRHTRLTFVESLDFRSGLGHMPERRWGHGVRCLVSDLGQFDFADGLMRLTHLHAGETVETIRSRTGFALDVAPGLAVTPPPSREELEILRNEIDPLGVRRLEFLRGPARRELILKVLAAEAAAY